MKTLIKTMINLLMSMVVPAVAFANDPEGYGLSERLQRRVADIERDYEARTQAYVSDFRLVREVEEFPPLEGRTMDVSVSLSDADQARLDRPGSPPAIASSHDRRTGAPLDSCLMPCTLQAPMIPPAMIQIYRYGSKPRHIGSEELTFLSDGDPVRLPFNEVDHQIVREECAAETALLLQAGEDLDADPCVRVPPEMPEEAVTSGHCMVAFDVTSDGDPVNVIVEHCTATVFCEPTQEALNRWIYHPAIRQGTAVPVQDLETKISYRLANLAGDLIPEPEDSEPQPCVGIV